MVADDWPDWLPVDWTVNIRKIDGRTVKCYVDSEGHTCYSKPEVFDHLKKTNKSTDKEKTQDADDSTIDLSADPNERPTKLTPRTSRRKSNSRDLSEDVLAGDGSSSEPLSPESKNKDTWLPEGWTVEVKVRQGGSSSGMRYKCYTDPESGQKFFSKPQVLSHLAKANRSAGGQKEGSTEPVNVTPISTWQEKSTTEPDNPQTHEATKVKKTTTTTKKKTESSRLSSDYEVVSRTPAEGLPEGWVKEVRVRKHASKKDPYYLDPLSDYVFFSKKDALRYLESGDVRSCVMKPIRRDVNNDETPIRRDLNNDDTDNVDLSPSREELTSPGQSKVTETPKELPNSSVEEPKTNESGKQNQKPSRSISGGVFNAPDEENSDWLPDGWDVEVHYRNSGMKFKVYKEVASGRKFYSKPQVQNYLAGGSSSNSRKRKESKSSAARNSSSSADVTRPKRSRKKNDDSSQNDDFQEVITTSAADGLPPGWIKEVRTKIYATHKRSDPFYTDPVTGYIFRSKADATRYLDTGDVNLCAIRPKVKDKDGKEVFVYTHDSQKPAKSSKGKGLFEDEDDDEENQTADPKNGNNPKPMSTRVKKQGDPAAAGSPLRTSKRRKGTDHGPDPAEGKGPGHVNQATWVNLEKQPADGGNMAYEIPEDDNWTDHCIDFAVKTLANEIMFNGQPMSGGFQEEKNETPTKVN